MRPRRLRGVNARALLCASEVETRVTAPTSMRTGDRLPPPGSRVDANGGRGWRLLVKPQRVTGILPQRVG